MSEGGLLAAFRLGEAVRELTTWAEVAEAMTGEDVLWLHLERTNTEAVRWLRSESGLPASAVTALLAEDTRPRCEPIGDGLLVNLRGVNLNPGEDPLDMISVRLWLQHDYIVSLRRPRVMAVNDIAEDLRRGEGPRTPGAFLERLAGRLVKRMEPVHGEIMGQLDALEDRVLEDDRDSRVKTDVHGLRLRIARLRRYLQPQRDALEAIVRHSAEWLAEHDRVGLRQSRDDVTRYVEDMESARERATAIADDLAAEIAEQANQRIYLLSIVAALFLPLSFLTGLLGINVGGMPGVDSALAFWIVCAVLVVLLGVELWLMRRLKWF